MIGSLRSLLLFAFMLTQPSVALLAQEGDESKVHKAIGLTGGVGLADVEGEVFHISLSYEDYWKNSGIGVIAEAGVVVGSGSLAGIVTPGLFYRLSKNRESFPFIRAGFSLVDKYPGFHLGAGFSSNSLGSGLRLEGRFTLTPGADDYFLEALITYRFAL